MRALIVCAVSTARQADADHVSLDEQMRLCREVCAARDWSVVGEVVIPGHSRAYNWLDELVSDSPDYASIIRQVRAGVTDLIVVRDMDRLWRTDALRAQVMALCREHHVQVYAVNQPVEPVDPSRLGHGSDSSMILEAISGVISEQENRTRTRRMVMGRRARAERRGLTSYGNGRVPYGYRSDGAGSIAPDPATAHYVRAVFGRRVAGDAFVRIARWLDDVGAPTPGHTPHWRPGAVRWILKNPVYYGAAYYQEVIRHDGQHEGLVSRATWDAAQEVTRLRANRRDRTGIAGSQALSGLLLCGWCDASMTLMAHGRYGGARLRCSRYMRTGGQACQSNGHTMEDVDAFVLAEVQRKLAHPELWDQAADNGDDTARRRLSELVPALADLDRRWQQWSHAYEIGAIGLDEMLMHRERVHGERDKLSRERDDLEARLQVAPNRVAAYTELATALDRLSEMGADELRHVYRALIAAVRLRIGNDPEIDWR